LAIIKAEMLRKVFFEFYSQANAFHGKSISSEIQPAPPKKCSEIGIEPLDDGLPEYEESFTMV
jgi:hypothetical protein